MKQYYAYEVVLNTGQPTFCLLPLSKEAVYVEGTFFPNSEKLVVIHPHQKEVFDLVEKFDDNGDFMMVKGSNRPKKERLRVNNNVNHQLSGKDIDWFLDNFVENPELAKSVIAQSKLKLTPASDIATAEDTKKSLIITE